MRSVGIATDSPALGRIISSERKRQGYTQAQLAEACGVGITYLCNLENGKETAELGKALRIIQMLGIDLVAQKRGE